MVFVWRLTTLLETLYFIHVWAVICLLLVRSGYVPVETIYRLHTWIVYMSCSVLKAVGDNVHDIVDKFYVQDIVD